MNTYKSWIPNVSGCLSFSNIKGSKIPGRAWSPHTYNRLSDDADGCIVSLQKRNLSDTIYAPVDLGGMFYYLLSAKVDDSSPNGEVLTGRIFAFPKLLLGSKDKALVKSFGNSGDAPKAAAIELINIWELHSKTILISFKLYRDGFAEFYYVGTDTRNAYPFILEAYSFLKDLVHSHKFHRYDDDAIVVPYPVENDADIKWIEKTARNLHKSIVSAYRNSTYRADLINALGRLSYLESFQQILAQRGMTLPHAVHSPTLRSSLETKLNSVEFIENGKAILLQIFVPIFLSLLALLITMTQLLQVPCIEGLTFTQEACSYSGRTNLFKLSDNSVEIARFLLEHWYELAVLLPSFTAIFIFLAHLQAILRWLNQRVGYGVMGWFQRVTFGIAVSTRFGRLIASAWVLILIATLLWLTYLASGHLFSLGF